MSFRFSENRGRLLENVVYLTLRRNENDIFYWKGKGEIDFLIRKGTRIDRLINVCWDLNEDNKKRELSGLTEAMDKFDLTDAEIIVSGYDDLIEFNGKKIAVKNIFGWLREWE